ncbi:MAG TPA: PQQ-binding-like beta-propeller repeat protein [Ktedonobacteraceae bacterium]|nr:PQQ-binding-like beta-propeller repeat protein [Ktedonobacteraceae bacterium]
MHRSNKPARQSLHVTFFSRYGLAVALLSILVLVLNIPSTFVFAQSTDWPTMMGRNARTDYNAAESVINRKTAPSLKLHWSTKASGSVSSQPIEANGMLYWGSGDGLEHATNPSTGIDTWATNLGQTSGKCVQNQGVTSIATVATVNLNGQMTPVVFVGGGNAQLYALNANTGAIIWQIPLGTQPDNFLYGGTAVYNGNVYIGVASLGDCPLVQGQVVQVNATTGTLQNVFNVVPTGCVGGSVWDTPTIDETTGILYVGTGNPGKCSSAEPYASALIALHTSDLSLADYWQVPSSQQITDGDFGSTPTLFTATINGQMHDMVGLEHKNGIYYAFDRTSIGSGPLWQARIAKTPPLQSGEVSISSSAWDGTNLYVAGAASKINGQKCQGNLRALNPTNGAVLWKVCLKKVVYSPAMAVPGLVEIGSGSSLYLYNSSTGKQLFTYQDAAKKSDFWGAATIINGMLFQGNMDGYLYAFGM